MKKTLLLALVALLLSAKAFAGGGNHSFTGFSLTYNYMDVKTSCKFESVSGFNDNFMLHGFSAGFIAHQQLVSFLYLTTGVHYQFAMKQENVTGGDFGVYNHNLKVPIKLAFSMAFGKKSGFSIHAGPSLDFMVSTQADYYYDRDNYAYTDMVSGRTVTRVAGYKTTATVSKTLGWFDIPLGVGATLNFGNFGLRFDYEWGMINRSLDTNSYSWKADQLTAGLFFIF